MIRLPEPSNESADVARLPAITYKEKGYFIEGENGPVGPFEYLTDLDPVSVAVKTGVPAKQILAAKLTIQAHLYRPSRGAETPDSSFPPLQVEAQDGSQCFIAVASQGPEVPASGFIVFEGDDWIAAETTYIYGRLGEGEVEREVLEPVIFFNHRGQRGCKLLKGSVFQVGGRALRPASRTLGISGPETLMTLNAGVKFLEGSVGQPQDVYDAMVQGLERFSNLDWDRRLYDVVACNIVAKYFYDLFGVFPIIVILGPYESGKTRLMLCIIYMAHRGMALLDPTNASVFRIAEAWKACLGIDEFWEINRELERLLRASYKRGVKVPRVEKLKSGVMHLGLFEVFGKVVIACPEPPPPNIASKGITIPMRRMPDPSPEKKDPEPRDFEPVREKGYLARLTWAPEVKARADELGKTDLGLSGRDYEVWKPALTIASMLGGQVWENVLSYAREACEEKRQGMDEELKEVIEAIYVCIRESKARFPVTFRPKQVHDIVWGRRKEDYMVGKEKQGAREGAGESYDYDTRRFERTYNVKRIGRTYLPHLGLSRRRTREGTLYEIASAQAFHEIVARYHPDLAQEEGYADLILNQKITPLLPYMQPKAGRLPFLGYPSDGKSHGCGETHANQPEHAIADTRPKQRGNGMMASVATPGSKEKAVAPLQRIKELVGVVEDAVIRTVLGPLSERQPIRLEELTKAIQEEPPGVRGWQPVSRRADKLGLLPPQLDRAQEKQSTSEKIRAVMAWVEESGGEAEVKVLLERWLERGWAQGLFLKIMDELVRKSKLEWVGDKRVRRVR